MRVQGLRFYFGVFCIRSPQNPILIIKVPTLFRVSLKALQVFSSGFRALGLASEAFPVERGPPDHRLVQYEGPEGSFNGIL